MTNPWHLSADVIEAAASAGTLLVAFLVFFEARRIRMADAIYRQNQAWNDFGKAVAELHGGGRVGQILLGREVGKGLVPIRTAEELEPTEAFLLMSFFNVVSSEYNAVRAKAIDENYVIHSLTMTTRIVRTNKSWIFTFLRDYGYEQSFRRVVAIVALTSDEIPRRRTAIRRELLAISLWGKLCGPKFRAWLRRHLNEGEVKALCDGEPGDEACAGDAPGIASSADSDLQGRSGSNPPSM